MNHFHSNAGQVSPGLNDLHDLCDAQANRIWNMNKPVVSPHNLSGSHKTGSLNSNLTKTMISLVLGFEPNCEDDEEKVTASWGFTVNGVPCGIWDYKGVRWSTFGPRSVFEALFPGKAS